MLTLFQLQLPFTSLHEPFPTTCAHDWYWVINNCFLTCSREYFLSSATRTFVGQLNITIYTIYGL